MSTTGHMSSWPGPHDRPRVLVEVPGGRWHVAHAARDAGLDVLICSGPRGRRARCPALSSQVCPLAAAADAIVVSHPPDDEDWSALIEEHWPQHPGVPVCVEAPPMRTSPAGALQLPHDADEGTIVSIVSELAHTHASRSDLWVGAAA